MTNKYFKVIRACEEIYRLKVEIPCLHDWITKEDANLSRIASSLQAAGNVLGKEIAEIRDRQLRVNEVHRTRICKIYALAGYSGPITNNLQPGGLKDEEEDEELLPDQDDLLGADVLALQDAMLRMSVD